MEGHRPKGWKAGKGRQLEGGRSAEMQRANGRRLASNMQKSTLATGFKTRLLYFPFTSSRNIFSLCRYRDAIYGAW